MDHVPWQFSPLKDPGTGLPKIILLVADLRLGICLFLSTPTHNPLLSGLS